MLDWQGRAYVSVKCGRCGVVLTGPASRMPWLEVQHEDRCRTATADERMARLVTGRWPRKVL